MVVWLAWLQLVWCVIAEVRAAVRNAGMPARVPLAGGTQPLVHRLVTAALLLFAPPRWHPRWPRRSRPRRSARGAGRTAVGPGHPAGVPPGSPAAPVTNGAAHRRSGSRGR